MHLISSGNTYCDVILNADHLGFAIRQFLAHDLAPLSHIFGYNVRKCIAREDGALELWYCCQPKKITQNLFEIAKSYHPTFFLTKSLNQLLVITKRFSIFYWLTAKVLFHAKKIIENLFEIAKSYHYITDQT